MRFVTAKDHSVPYVAAFMLRGRLVQAVVGCLDQLRKYIPGNEPVPEHLRLGFRGEDDAYFALRKMGYLIVERNFRSPRCRGEIDLIGWDGDVLCFVEVKTRTSRDLKTAEAAVDRHKRREVAEVSREYLRKAPPLCQWRFDIVSVYYDGRNSRPLIEVFRNASLAA